MLTLLVDISNLTMDSIRSVESSLFKHRRFRVLESLLILIGGVMTRVLCDKCHLAGAKLLLHAGAKGKAKPQSRKAIGLAATISSRDSAPSFAPTPSPDNTRVQ